MEPSDPKPDRWLVTAGLKFDMSRTARELRRRSTNSEQVLWALLRRKQLGIKFRRQQPIGNFVVDFYAADARFVVEVDGGIHETHAHADAERQLLLESLGLRVLRLTAAAVEADPEAAVEVIRRAINPLP